MRDLKKVGVATFTCILLTGCNSADQRLAKKQASYCYSSAGESVLPHRATLDRDDSECARVSDSVACISASVAVHVLLNIASTCSLLKGAYTWLNCDPGASECSFCCLWLTVSQCSRCLFVFRFFFGKDTRGKQDVHVSTCKNSMLPVARNMLCKFSSCKIYYCKDIISKNFTVFLQGFLLATCLDIKILHCCIFLARFLLVIWNIPRVFSCKIYFLQDVFIKILARLARYLQVLARRFYMGSAVPTGKPLTHGQHSGSLAAVIVLQLTGNVYDWQYAAISNASVR